MKKSTRVIFGIYIALLVWLVLFKLAYEPNMIPHFRGVNFVPFYYDQESDAHLSEVLYNIVVFLPMGAFLSRRNGSSFMEVVGYGFLISLLFEGLQYVFALGASDITDLMMNTLGTGLGFFLYALFGKLLGKRTGMVMDIVMTVLMCGFLFLYGITIMVNL